MKYFLFLVMFAILTTGCITLKNKPAFPALGAIETFKIQDKFYKVQKTNIVVQIIRSFSEEDKVFAASCMNFANGLTANGLKFFPDFDKYYMANFSGYAARAVTDHTNVYVNINIIPTNNMSSNSLYPKMEYGRTLGHEWAHLEFKWTHYQIVPEWEKELERGFGYAATNDSGSGLVYLFHLGGACGLSKYP